MTMLHTINNLSRIHTSSDPRQDLTRLLIRQRLEQLEQLFQILMFTFRLSVLCFRVLAQGIAGRAFTATGSVAVTLWVQKIRRLLC